ncbi:MAG: RNA polymerase sigma factor [Steroidobacteraceae bacterium]
MADTTPDWFIREILCHEAALTRFITRAWPHPADVLDIRHDAYIRVFEAALKSRPHSPKSFLFTTARNVMADRARRLRIVSMDLVEDLDALNVLVDEASPERRASGRQQLARLTAAFNQLPPRCREVVWLQRVEGLAMKEIAARLGMALGTAEKHAFTGIRLLAEYFYGEESTKAVDTNQDDREAHGPK